MEAPVRPAEQLVSRTRRRSKGKEKALDPLAENHVVAIRHDEDHQEAESSQNAVEAARHTSASEAEAGSLHADENPNMEPAAAEPEASTSEHPLQTKPGVSDRLRKKRSKPPTATVLTVEDAQARQEKKGKIKSRQTVKERDKKRLRQERSGDEKSKPHMEDFDLASWECIPLAQNQVLQIPPVWSHDGR